MARDKNKKIFDMDPKIDSLLMEAFSESSSRLADPSLLSSYGGGTTLAETTTSGIKGGPPLTYEELSKLMADVSKESPEFISTSDGVTRSVITKGEREERIRYELNSKISRIEHVLLSGLHKRDTFVSDAERREAHSYLYDMCMSCPENQCKEYIEGFLRSLDTKTDRLEGWLNVLFRVTQAAERIGPFNTYKSRFIINLEKQCDGLSDGQRIQIEELLDEFHRKKSPGEFLQGVEEFVRVVEVPFGESKSRIVGSLRRIVHKKSVTLPPEIIVVIQNLRNNFSRDGFVWFKETGKKRFKITCSEFCKCSDNDEENREGSSLISKMLYTSSLYCRDCKSLYIDDASLKECYDCASKNFSKGKFVELVEHFKLQFTACDRMLANNSKDKTLVHFGLYSIHDNCQLRSGDYCFTCPRLLACESGMKERARRLKKILK